MVTRLAKSIDGISTFTNIYALHKPSRPEFLLLYFLIVPHPRPSITTYSQSSFLFVVAEDHTWLTQCVGASAIAPVFRN